MIALAVIDKVLMFSVSGWKKDKRREEEEATLGGRCHLVSGTR